MTSKQTDKRPVLLITHIRAADVGELPSILNYLNIPYQILRMNKGDELPVDISIYQGVVILGGVQSANDDHIDYIFNELKWLDSLINRNFKIFGICLGAQLVARALGAEVSCHPDGLYSFGWYSLKGVNSDVFSLGNSFTFYHRHSEIFSLPQGALLTATRPNYPNQGFIYGKNIVATQFHPEVNQSLISDWLIRKRPLPDEGLKGSQNVDLQIADTSAHIPRAHSWLKSFMHSWLDLR